MTELFVKIVLGHLAGDYLFQNKEMALKKSLPGLDGFGWCLLHCVIYTLTVCLIASRHDPLFISLIFLSHFLIDRWSLGEKWLKLIHGRTFEAAFSSVIPYREIDIAFTSIVYTIVDNTWHLLLIYLLLPFVL